MGGKSIVFAQRTVCNFLFSEEAGLEQTEDPLKPINTKLNRKIYQQLPAKYMHFKK